MLKAISSISIALILAVPFLFGGPVLAQIAPGVTQSAARTANITGTVVQSDGTPVADANVQLSGTAVLSTKSDAHGVFIFRSVPWGTYQIVVTSAIGTALREKVPVSGDISLAIQYQAPSGNGLKEIAHVSTSGAGAHINVTSSSITSITPSEYAFQGNGTWQSLFTQIPGVAVSGLTSGGGGTLSGQPGNPLAPVSLSLNGALPYESSTTLDGMPLESTSPSLEFPGPGNGVDLSVMPVNAFDTADIVRGPGANAPSIVDSVGGSFVLHAPGEVDANHVEFSASNDAYGGIVSNIKMALHLGRLSATFIYGVNDSPGALGTSEIMPDFSPSPFTIDGQPLQGPTGMFNTTSQSGIINCNCSYTNSLLFCCLAQSTAWTSHNGAASLVYKVTPSITAQVFYAGSVSRVYNTGPYYPVEFAPAASVPAYSGSLAPSPPGQTTYSLLNTGPESLENEGSSLLEEKVTAFVGHGVVRLAALQNNTFSYTDLPFCLPNGTYTLWGTASVGPAYPGTPTAYNGTPETLTFGNEFAKEHFWSNNRDLLGSYAVQVGSASSIGISYVTSYYNDPYFYNLYVSGSQIPILDQTTATSETTNETRIHVDTEVGNKLSLGLSWYFADGTYHTPSVSNPSQWTNSTFPYSAPRFGAVWQASPNIAIRASAGGGYALPQLDNLTGTPPVLDISEYVQTIPNPNLKPEESFGFDVGTDIRFHRTTILSFDLYRTNLYGQFFTNTTTSTFNGLPLYITQFGNIGTSRMEGINLDIRHDVPSGYYWHGTLGLTRGYVVSLPAGFYNSTTGFPPVPCTNCTNQNIIPGANFNSAAYSGGVPYTSASAEIGYRWSPGKYIDLAPTYYGNNNIYNEPAFVELDAHAGYPLTKNVSLLAIFRNITGIYDQNYQVYNPTYRLPVVQGATGYYQGALFGIPYGPRSVIVTANFKF